MNGSPTSYSCLHTCGIKMKTQLDNANESDRLLLCNEYKMFPEQVERDIDILMHWINKTPHLPTLPKNKEGEVRNWLENLLLMNRNSLEKTKDCVDSYFLLRALHPNILLSDSALYSEYYNDVSVVVLEPKAEDGSRILIIGFNSTDPQTFKLQELCQRIRMILEAFLRNKLDFTSFVVILDIRNLVFSHMAQIDLVFLKQVLSLGKKMLPLRIKNVHLLYTASFIEKCILILKPFFSRKIMDRLVHHKSTESLAKSLSSKVLPKDLGGELPDTQCINNEWRNVLRRKSNWFLEDESLVSVESKRSKDNNNDKFSMSSVTGSFRKLCID
nr:PREDICTED: alpha-tocopherol transfer protein-like isoform X2 [Bemisia tabaci]